MEGIEGFVDLVGEFDRAQSVVRLARNGPSVSALPGEDHRVVLAESGDVNSDSKWCIKVHIDLSVRGHGCVNIGCGEELHFTDTRELPEDAYTDKVRIGSVGFDPLVKSSFVCNGDCAGVNLASVPEFCMFATCKAFFESARVSSRVTKGEPEDLGFIVGKGTFGCLPD